MLCPVAVVNVEVEDRHPIETVLVDQVLGGHSDVVEIAETHGGGTLRVVSGRADRGQGLTVGPAHYPLRRRERGFDRRQ